MRTQADFGSAIAGYELIPQSLVSVAARTIPRAEVAAGMLLAVGVYESAVALLTSLLLAVFSAAMAVNLMRGRVIDCGCTGGAVSRPIGWSHVLLNLGLISLSILVVLRAPSGAFSPPTDGVLPAVLVLGALGVSGSLAGHAVRALRIGAR